LKCILFYSVMLLADIGGHIAKSHYENAMFTIFGQNAFRLHLLD